MKLKPCGTTAAYFRHIRKREKPCDPCRTAASRERAKYPKYRERKWLLTDQVCDWLGLDGGWLTAEGLALELDRNSEAVSKVLRRLRAEGLVESRTVELAGLRDREQRTEWRWSS